MATKGMEHFLQYMRPDSFSEGVQWGMIGLGSYLFGTGLKPFNIQRMLLGASVFAAGTFIDDLH